MNRVDRCDPSQKSAGSKRCPAAVAFFQKVVKRPVRTNVAKQIVIPAALKISRFLRRSLGFQPPRTVSLRGSSSDRLSGSFGRTGSSMSATIAFPGGTGTLCTNLMGGIANAPIIPCTRRWPSRCICRRLGVFAINNAVVAGSRFMRNPWQKRVDTERVYTPGSEEQGATHR